MAGSVWVGVGLAAALWASPASAHIELQDPVTAASPSSTTTGNELGDGNAVAMNGTPGSSAAVFNANGAPGSGSSSSSAGGCSVGAAGPHTAGSFALLGLLAAVGLRWRPRRGRALSVQAL